MSDTKWQGSPYTSDEIKKRIAASQEIGLLDFNIRGGFSQENFFYFSFADSNLPKGTQWLGGCYIRADSIDEASVLSRVLNINPGGSVQIVGPFSGKALREDYAHRLLKSREDLDRAIDTFKLTGA